MGDAFPPLEVRVWAPWACFTRPQMKVERVTYAVPPPSAARGILEAIFWRPEFHWDVREVWVLKPIRYGSLFLTMCQTIVASRRMTATRAIFDPRRFLIFAYQAFIDGSRRNTCTTHWLRINRAMGLPSLVMDPRRSVASPEFRQPGVKPQ